MAATASEAVALLNKMVKQLRNRQPDITRMDEAYRGEFLLQYASSDFMEFFANRYEHFSDNWCAIVADAPHERLEPIGIRLPDSTTGDPTLWRTWLDTASDAFADMAMLDAIITGRSFGLVWGLDNNEAAITWEHPSQCIVGYDPETRARKAGLKAWHDDDNEYATLYLPDELWKFKRRRSALWIPQQPGELDGGWTLRDEEWIENPLGKVPLVELPNRPRLLADPISDIRGALSMQHAVNMIWSQLFVALDSGSWPQRVIYGAEMPTIPVLDEDGVEVGELPIDLKKFAQDKAIWLEDPNVKIDQWSATNLEAYTKIIEIAVGHLAAQTRTPAHYLLIGGTIANVSGDAMKALETGLVKRTEEKTQHFGRAIRDIFELVALAQGDEGRAASVRRGTVLWKDVENRSDAQRADALSKKKDMGYPLRYILELDGLPPEEVDRVMTMVEQEAANPLTRALMKDIGLDETAAAAQEASGDVAGPGA
jgi:Phage portal protein, SPP1 Gp6-like